MIHRIYVNIMPHEALLDPAGKATQAALVQLGFDSIYQTRIGKRIRLDVEAPNLDAAMAQARAAAEQLLINSVIESFSLEAEVPSN
jgi:phosphoribosylformylglycinamidine synthase PurS subunit